MTPLQERIAEAIATHGPQTAKQIAERLGNSVRSVLNSLQYGRGDGVFSDGTVIYDWPDGGACAHRSEPVIWLVGDTVHVAGRCPALTDGANQ